MTWNPYLVRRRALRFKRGQWKCSCIGGQILPTQNIQQPQKINLRVTHTIHDFSVWNKPLIWSTHVNIVQLAEPISRYMYVYWRMQVFKIEGFVCKHFLSSPPLPQFPVFGSCSFLTWPENPVPRVFLCSERIQRLLHRLHRRLGVDFSFRWSMFDSWPRYQQISSKPTNLFQTKGLYM